MAQSGTVCCWAIRLWYSRMTCAYSALAYSAPRRSIRARMMSGAACGSGVPCGDHRVILRERRAGQRVTRLFFAGRGIGKAHQFGGGVQLQVTLFRRRQFDAIRRAESRESIRLRVRVAIRLASAVLFCGSRSRICVSTNSWSQLLPSRR